MAMKKLDTRTTENLNAELAEQANKLKTTQEELITLQQEMDRNRTQLRQGDIAKEVFNENIKKMRENETRLKSRAREAMTRKLQLLNQTESLLKRQEIRAKQAKKPKRTARRAHHKAKTARRRKR